MTVFDQAQKFLLDHDLPLRPSLRDILRLCYEIGAEVHSYAQGKLLIEHFHLEEYQETKSGFTCFFDKKPVIFYKDALAYEEKIFVLCHELGHIYLQHTFAGILGYSPDPAIKAAQESEADDFAILILAPVPVLQRTRAQSIGQIQQLTGLSQEHSAKAELLTINYGKAVGNGQDDGELIKKYQGKIRKFALRKYRKIMIRSAAVCAAIAIIGLTYGLGAYSRENTPPVDIPQSHAPSSIALPTPTPKVTAAAPTPKPTAAPVADPQGDMVYVTSSGTKYHRADCYHIRDKRVTALTIDEAQEEGYSACKTCRP